MDNSRAPKCTNSISILVRQVDQTTGELTSKEEVLAECYLQAGHRGYHKYALPEEAHEPQTQESPSPKADGSVG